MSLKRLIILLSGLALAVVAHTQTITTFAGNGTYGYSGDGGPATSAQFAWQMGLTIDNSGKVYIADHDNNVIRVVNTAGTISTFAGNHTAGFSGDGGPATAAALFHPTWLTADNFGNLFFIDQNNEVIRKIDAAGIITTLTNGTYGYTGDGGPLSAASFRTITGITIDVAGNMYITDWGNSAIRKVNTAGIISTIAGTGSAGFTGDGGPATAAQLNFPYTVKLDNAGNIYIPDNGNQRIRKINSAGIITTAAGTGGFGNTGDGGPATAATFRYPWAISIDNNNNIYVSDAGNDVVRKIDAAGIITAFAGNGTSGYSGDGGPALAAQLSDVCVAVADNSGDVYISQRTPHYVIRKVTNCQAAVIVTQSGNVTFCNTGNPTNASFSIVTNNAAIRQWQVNTGSGWTNLSDNAMYGGSSTDQLTVTGVTPAMNGYQYRCAVTNGCTIYSTAALLTVYTMSTPSLTIFGSNLICAGTPVNFSATPSVGTVSPVYQWKKNGVNVGTNHFQYIDNNLSDGDIVSCVMTTSNVCATTNTVTSNSITVTVKAPVTPTVSIAAVNNNTCAGAPITFNATATNVGSAYAFTWFRNGVNLLLNSPTYTITSPNNGDFVKCVVQTFSACVTTSVAVSNEIAVNITLTVTPTITITSSSPALCKGSTASFSAATTHEGSSPVYQWRKNGIPVGTNSPVYSDNALAAADVVDCILTSNANCLATPTASSNAISLIVYENPVITIGHTNSLCTSSPTSLDPGNYASYLWDDGSTDRIRNINTPGTYHVEVTDNNGCKGTGTTTITTVFTSPSGFAPPDTAVCSYGAVDLKAKTGYASYLWSTGATSSTITVTAPDIYWVEVTTQNGCTAKESLTVSPKDCMKGVYIPSAFTPNNDGRNDVFKPLVYGNVKQYKFQVFNRWGEIIFQSSNPANGWDGTNKGIKLETNVFVWVCSYQLEGEEKKAQRGTVVVIR